jgi:hypothetical protein
MKRFLSEFNYLNEKIEKMQKISKDFSCDMNDQVGQEEVRRMDQLAVGAPVE